MPKKLPTWIELDEFLLLLKNTKSKHHKVAFLLGYESGLRISEMVKLEKEQVDVERKNIMIREAKGGKDRVVPLPKHWRRDFINEIPIKCGMRSLQRAFIMAAKKSGLKNKKPDISVHSLRHGFAKRLVDKGVPINQIQLLMGHSAASTTSIYLHANPKEALEKYEDLF
jgi:integrase/recombinase XerD